jgi:hypothetical protein
LLGASCIINSSSADNNSYVVKCLLPPDVIHRFSVFIKSIVMLQRFLLFFLPGCWVTSQGQRAFWFSFFLSGGSLLGGCRKGQRIAPGPIVAESVSDPIVLKLLDRLNQDPQSRMYFQQLSKTYGEPQWQVALTAASGNTHLILLPYADPNYHVTSIVAMELDTALRLKVYDAAGHHETLARQQMKRILGLCEYLLSGRQPLKNENIQFNAIHRDVAVDDNLRSQLPLIGYQLTTCYEWMACIGDGRGNCVSNITYHRECITNLIWLLGFEAVDYYAPPLPYPRHPYLGGATANPSIQQLPSPKLPILNIQQYLQCFNPSLPGKLYIFVDQPAPGYDDPFSILGKMGHVFIALEQTINGVTVRRNIGFHPADKINPFNRTQSPSILGNDERHRFDVSFVHTFNGDDFMKIMSAVTEPLRTYDLEQYNCVDFVFDVAAAGGLYLPQTKGWWIFGRGHNPGNFGEDLRRMPNAIFRTADAPTNAGSCP